LWNTEEENFSFIKETSGSHILENEIFKSKVYISTFASQLKPNTSLAPPKTEEKAKRSFMGIPETISLNKQNTDYITKP